MEKSGMKVVRTQKLRVYLGNWKEQTNFYERKQSKKNISRC